MNYFPPFKILPRLIELKNWVTGIDLALVKSWIPLLKVLKVLGNAPMEIKPIEVQTVLEYPNVKEKLFEFNIQWFSPWLICVLVWGAVRALNTLNVYSDLIFPDPAALSTFFGVADKSETEKLIKPMLHYCMPILGWFEWIGLLIRYPDFQLFLNNWQILDQETYFWKSGQNKSGELLSHLVIIYAFGFATISFRITSEWETLSQLGTYKIHLLFAAGIMNLILSLFEDAKSACMLFSVSTSLKKIRFRVQAVIDETEKKAFTMTRKHNTELIIQECQRGHSLLKEQVRLIGYTQGIHEICFLCFLVLVVTINLFLTLSPIFRGQYPDPGELKFNCSGLLFGLFRLYVKCHHAEEITKEDKLLADALYSWQLSKIPEAKMFADLIVWNQMKVVYCSVVTMDKRLILKIAGQILTYFIILLQFQLSFGTNQQPCG